MKLLLCAASALVGLASSQAWAQGVPVGVYDCFGTYNINAGKFSVVAPGRYMSRGGGSGSFEFDGVTLSMVDGPYEGMRYRKVPDYWTFRLLRDNGDDSPFMCPQNTSKDPRNPRSW